MNYGYKPPFLNPKQVLGGVSLGKRVQVPSGQWDEFLPLYEPQNEGYETWGCTVWGTENQCEILIKKAFDYEPNYDERYLYNIVKITPPGADPNDVYEAIEDYGLINARPFPATYEEFCKPRPMTHEFISEGRQWTKKYSFSHKWIFYPMSDLKYKQEQIMKALIYSPLGVSVVGWKKQGEYYTKKIGEIDNHWCVLYGYEYKKYWKIFDSYDHSMKKLAWDYDFGNAKMIEITEKPKQSWFQKILSFFLEWK